MSRNLYNEKRKLVNEIYQLKLVQFAPEAKTDNSLKIKEEINKRKTKYLILKAMLGGTDENIKQKRI